MLKVWWKSWEPFRIYQLTSTANSAIICEIGQEFLQSLSMDSDHKWDVKNDFAYVLQFFSLISDSLGGVTTYIIMKFLLWLGNVWSLDGGLKMDPSLPKSKIPTFILQYHGAPLHYTDLLSECNLVFTILFTVECFMKLSSFGYQVKSWIPRLFF